jgi:hypothetical protein
MGELTDGNDGGPEEADAPVSRGLANRVRETIALGAAKVRSTGEHHASVAIPFRAIERNRGVAASVLAGGVAYRLFLWLLPFGLIVGGALGLGDAEGLQGAVASGGLPQAVVNAIGDIARAADTNSWWLLLTGVPLLLWEGYTGARALQLIHSLVWGRARAPHPAAAELARVLRSDVRVRRHRHADVVAARLDAARGARRPGAHGRPAGRAMAEFGYVERLAELTPNTKRGTRGFILPPSSAPGNPGENELLPDTVTELQRLALSPREVALDGGFQTKAGEEALAPLALERIYIAGRPRPHRNAPCGASAATAPAPKAASRTSNAGTGCAAAA